MKKKILFVINNLNCGGAEKSLISLLDSIDYSKYEVDLYLFKHTGIFMDKIPNSVNLLSEPAYYKYFDMPFKKAIYELISRGKINIAIARILSVFIFRHEKNPAIIEQKVWKFLKVVFYGLEKEYDAAIGYLEKNPIYFIIDKVKAKKKIGWIHTNYKSMGMSKKIDNIYFEKLDNIITVSDSSAQTLREVFPNQSKKIKVIQNIIFPDMINYMSKNNVNYNKNYINIVSVGRLTKAKGYDLVIDTCESLVKLKSNIRWYIIGEGEERERLENLINKKKLNDNIFLLGMKENPYPYIKEADVYCQTSIYEGIGISIMEAKVLKKPIIVTDFESAENQIYNGKNGLIVKRDKNALANGILELINNKALRAKLINNLANEKMDNKVEIEKLYEII